MKGRRKRGSQLLCHEQAGEREGEGGSRCGSGLKGDGTGASPGGNGELLGQRANVSPWERGWRGEGGGRGRERGGSTWGWFMRGKD
jgi:hypothetical protein